LVRTEYIIREPWGLDKKKKLTGTNPLKQERLSRRSGGNPKKGVNGVGLTEGGREPGKKEDSKKKKPGEMDPRANRKSRKDSKPNQRQRTSTLRKKVKRVYARVKRKALWKGA